MSGANRALRRRVRRSDGRRVVVTQVLLLLILVGGTVYVADSVVQGSLFSDPITVEVELAEAAGLHERSDVTYRGSSVGRVTEMRITPAGVTAEVELRPDVRVPAGSEAVVANLSAVGEQYLDFRPDGPGGPYLADGDRIGRERTTLPLAPATMIGDAFNLSRRLDVDDVRTVSRELGTAFGDPDLNLLQVSQQAEQLFEMLEDLQPQTISLVETGQTPLRTSAEWGTGMAEFARDLDAVTGAVRESDGDLRGLVEQGRVVLPELDALLAETEDSIGRLLVAALGPAQIYFDRQPALNAWLDWAPLQMVAMAGSTENQAGGVTLVTNLGPNCQYATRQKNPTSTRRTAPPEDAQCHEEHKYVQQRGSKFVPRPR